MEEVAAICHAAGAYVGAAHPLLVSLLQISHYRTFHSICLPFTFRFCSASCDTTLSLAQLFLRGDGSERRPLVKSIFSLSNKSHHSNVSTIAPF